MKKLISFSIIILLFALVLTQCAKQDENVVVTVGDLTITDSQIRDALKEKYPKKDNFKDIELGQKK